MADSAAATTMGTRLIQIVIAILGIVGLYYMYTYLFSSSAPTYVTLISKKTNVAELKGQTSDEQLIFSGSKLPPIYTGGEFSISTWINLQSLSMRGSDNKCIIRMGSQTNDFIRIYLGAKGAQLMVRFSSTSRPLLTDDNVLATDSNQTFPLSQITATGTSEFCDILQIDMQRWIHIVVSVNGKSCDVYLDGKLARSCPLEEYITIPQTSGTVSNASYSAYLLDNGKTGTGRLMGGFGGYISTTRVYGLALSPDVVYQDYMAGPEATTSLWTYLSSFFSPSAVY